LGHLRPKKNRHNFKISKSRIGKYCYKIILFVISYLDKLAVHLYRLFDILFFQIFSPTIIIARSKYFRKNKKSGGASPLPYFEVMQNSKIKMQNNSIYYSNRSLIPLF